MRFSNRQLITEREALEEDIKINSLFQENPIAEKESSYNDENEQEDEDNNTFQDIVDSVLPQITKQEID